MIVDFEFSTAYVVEWTEKVKFHNRFIRNQYDLTLILAAT